LSEGSCDPLYLLPELENGAQVSSARGDECTIDDVRGFRRHQCLPSRPGINCSGRCDDQAEGAPKFLNLAPRRLVPVRGTFKSYSSSSR
jgi:hypothetical protein